MSPRPRPGGMNGPRIFLIVAVALLLAACASQPGASPITRDGAVALALAQDEQFAGIGPLNPDLVGQSAWYEVAGGQDGWQVKIRIGWGDCPAGCISQHTWTYAVSRDGTVELVGEEGDPMAGSGVHGTVVAGPTCPVVTDPPDPGCDERVVGGATLVILDAAGMEVARATSAADGTFSVALQPGAYRLVAQPVEGLMGTSAEMDFSVQAGELAAEVTVAYDTGIR